MQAPLAATPEGDKKRRGIKVAMITGAGSGIGRETALLFAKEGAKVVITGRTAEKLEEVCNERHENGGKAIFKTGDVSKREDMDDVVNTAMNEFGRIDILINNAGINKDALVTTMTKEQWNGVIAVSYTHLTLPTN